MTAIEFDRPKPKRPLSSITQLPLSLVRAVLRLSRYRFGTIGLILMTLITIATVFGPMVYTVDPNRQEFDSLFEDPSWSHPLGTDDIGRDQLARVLEGARVSLRISIASMAIAATLGTLIGVTAGYVRGRLDWLISLILDSVLAFPVIIFALTMATVLGTGIQNLTIALGIVLSPGFARLARGETLSVRERDYVQAARVLGAWDIRIVLRHVIPNIVAPLMVMATVVLAFAIQAEAALSFLGLGGAAPQAAWGSMIKRGIPFMQTAPWMVIAPGTAIILAVLGLTFVGDALREALDPRLRPGTRGDH
jgi:peptide/nickel transport system permease protein